MNRSLSLAFVVVLAACSKETPAASTSAPADSGKTMPPTKPIVTTTAAAAATTAAAAANTAAYHGLKPDHTIAGYLRDPKDSGSCAVLMAKPGDKPMTPDDLKKVAEMMKGEVVASCPTDNIVGACSGMGMAEQYYGPKYTKESAKLACKGVWKD